MDGVAHGPASIAALRDAVQKGREPPPADSVARLPSYWLFVIGTVCIGAFMGQVDSSIAQLLLPQARAGIQCATEHRELGRRGLSARHGGVSADLWPPRRHDGAQAPVYRWLPAVRAELGAVRPCAKPAGAHRLSRPARDRRGAAVVEQRRHRGGGGRSGAARPRARHPVGGPSRRSEHGARARRAGAGTAGLAMGVLDQRAGRPRRHRPGMVPASAHQRPAG